MDLSLYSNTLDLLRLCGNRWSQNILVKLEKNVKEHFCSFSHCFLLTQRKPFNIFIRTSRKPFRNTEEEKTGSTLTL